MGAKSQARKYQARKTATDKAAAIKSGEEAATRAKMETPGNIAKLTPKELKALGYKRTAFGWKLG
jgi:hypothetical protein